MIPAACVLLTGGILFYIFGFGWNEQLAAAPVKTRLMYLGERQQVVYENLRDLNFDYRSGKLPEADYQGLRAGLEEEAAVILAEMETLSRAEKFSGSLAADIPGNKQRHS